MKLGPIAQNPLEWMALKAGLVPTPTALGHFGYLISKFLLEAIDKGIFEAIGHSKVSLVHIATTCKLNERALKSLIGVLASMSLIDVRNDQFFLTKPAKKWLLKDSPESMYWLLMFDNKVCFKWMDYVGEFLETGKGLQYHDTFSDEEWLYYQKAMEAAAAVTSKEAVTKIPVPAGATTMLDIGGSHGLFSIRLCKKYKGLQSVIFDLPEAVDKAKNVAEKHNMQSTIKYVAGNVLTDDLGENKYDVILMSSLAHHFTNEQNLEVAQKVSRALKPGGFFTILEIIRRDEIKLNSNMLATIGDFFFAMSSTSGAWSLQEIKQWQKQAGLVHYQKRTFLTIPGFMAITAQKK
jgi:2-polyprenyl-3-methyl-5-hydroxy-6-metoxy-1,4-benzoquinol methylase